MASLDEQILRTTKEIMVKFIEVGRVYPASFRDTFRNVYQTVERTVKGVENPPEEEPKKKKK
jgi:hypothetical protein